MGLGEGEIAQGGSSAAPAPPSVRVSPGARFVLCARRGDRELGDASWSRDLASMAPASQRPWLGLGLGRLGLGFALGLGQG